MEETKYYTPTIEEFHVGFECEWYDHDDSIWQIYTVNTQANLMFITAFDDIPKRVKCLDQEDIESFGFKLWTYKGNELGFMLNPDEDESTWIHRIEGKIKISTTFPDTTLYLGKIKNKSELKRLLKQLEII